jgi:hypothetical protein
MVQRICPYCRCEDSCRREAFVSRPHSYASLTSTEVYAAVVEVYSHDPAVLDLDTWYLTRHLFTLGYLNSMPRLVDVGHAQELIREGERYQ